MDNVATIPSRRMDEPDVGTYLPPSPLSAWPFI